jgi:putative ABC transport system ATP-binding protein
MFSDQWGSPPARAGRRGGAEGRPRTLLEARDLVRRYPVGERLLTVIEGVSLDVGRGEFLVITGPSRSGKTPLITLLSGLDRPDAGTVTLDGRELTALSEEQLAPVRNAAIGFVFQSYHLIPSLSALENVMFPAELRGDAQARAKAEALLAKAGVAGRAASFPRQLSGGEKQRVAICRALVNEPAVVFADEPTGNLDSASGSAVMELMLGLQRERGTALVMVTHSAGIAARADRVVTLVDGRIVASP